MTIPWVIVCVIAAGLWVCLTAFFWADIVNACRRERDHETYSDGCTCEQRFFPDALDARCPHHGTAALRPCSPLDAAGDVPRLPSSSDRFLVVTTCLAYPPGSCPNKRLIGSDLCVEHLSTVRSVSS